MPFPFHLVDAFTSQPFAGNPAAVYRLESWPDSDWLQKVAAEMNQAETAFLVRSGDGFDLRWFTPTIEVDLCGHATLASAHVLWSNGAAHRESRIQFFTRSGTLTASPADDMIELDFPLLPETPAAPPPELAQALGLTPIYIGQSRHDLIVEVANENELRAAKPDMSRLASIATRGIIVTARSASAEFDFISRFFAPAAGIPEDPVTGSAHCCLADFWRKRLRKDSFRAYQASPRGGIVHVRIAGDRAILGGQAVTVARGELCEHGEFRPKGCFQARLAFFPSIHSRGPKLTPVRNPSMTSIPQPQPRLAVAMIVRNAAAELRGTIQTICDLADEIVVLDTGSTDDTPAVASALGAKLVHRPWDDDFAAARNACLAGVSSQWVLWLDAGEHLPPDSQAALSRALHEPLNLDHAYLLPIVLPSKSGEVPGEQSAQLRLHPNRRDLRFDGRVRERLDESLAAAGLQLNLLDVPLQRSDRQHEPELRASRAQRNIRLADLAIAERGPSAGMHNCLGEALQTLAMPCQAADHYRRALELAALASTDELEAYYGLLSCLDCPAPQVQTPDRQAQLTLCMKALERFPLDAHLLVALGIYLRSQDHQALAARAFDAAFRHGQIEPRLWHISEIREIAASSAAATHVQLGEATAARTLLEAAVRMFPHSQKLQKQLDKGNGRLSIVRIDDSTPKAVPPFQSNQIQEKTREISRTAYPIN